LATTTPPTADLASGPDRPGSRGRLVGFEARRRTARSVLFAVAGVLVVAAAAVAISRSSIFAVRHLTVVGNRHLTAADIERVAGVSSRTNVIWMSSATMERRLAADPWIASVGVSRLLPSSITITLRERSPVAVVEARGGGSMLVAADGTVLGPAPQGTRLPTVQVPAGLTLKSGSRVPPNTPALRAAADFPSLVASRIAEVSLGREGIELRTRDGIRVVYGDASGAASKGTAIEAVLVWLEQHHVTPLYIDVSAPTTPAVMPVNGQVTGIPGTGSDATATPTAAPPSAYGSPEPRPTPSSGG
jgi:cell division protein FtsQ